MKLLFLLVISILLYSCESTDVQDPVIEDVPVQQIETMPEVLDEASTPMDISGDENSVVEPIVDNLEQPSTEEIFDISIDEPVPTLIEEAEVVLEDSAEMVLSDDDFDTVVLANEDLIVQEIEVLESNIEDSENSENSFIEEKLLVDEVIIPETTLGETEVVQTLDEDINNTETIITPTITEPSGADIPLIPLTEATPIIDDEVDEVPPLYQQIETITENLNSFSDTSVTDFNTDVTPFFDTQEQDTSINIVTPTEQVIESVVLDKPEIETLDTDVGSIVSENENEIPQEVTSEETTLTENETQEQLAQGIVPSDTMTTQELSSEEMETVIIPSDTLQTDADNLTSELQDEQNSLFYTNEATTPIIDEIQTVEEAEELPITIVVSQTLELFEGEYIDIFLPGQGWIFLGEVENAKPIVVDFYARYIDGFDTLFNFYAENEGSTILHFYKQDIIANEYLDEYIEVRVKEVEKSLTSRPRQNTSDNSFGISSEPEVSLIGGESQILDDNDTLSESEYEFVPEDLLDQAQIAYDEMRFSDSIVLLDEYTSFGVDEIDRALFLYGQNYEAASDLRNIRQAVASYQKITESFPDSMYWEDSDKRITYLERFYINIR